MINDLGFIILGGNETLQNDSFEFGRHLGIAFQLVDDILDYVSSSAVLGKPAANDLKQGLATCPVLFAAKQYPELNQLISRRFSLAGDVEKAYEIVLNSDGLQNTRNLAKQHCDFAINIVSCCLIFNYIFLLRNFEKRSLNIKQI